MKRLLLMAFGMALCFATKAQNDVDATGTGFSAEFGLGNGTAKPCFSDGSDFNTSPSTHSFIYTETTTGYFEIDNAAPVGQTKTQAYESIWYGINDGNGTGCGGGVVSIDMSNEQSLQIAASANPPTDIRIDFQDVSSNLTSKYPQNITLTSGMATYTVDYSGNFITGADVLVDSTQINSMLIYIAPGDATYRGTISIDFIRVGSLVVVAGMNEKVLQESVVLYPNPADDKSILDFTLTESAEVNYAVTSIVGETVVKENLGVLQSGANSFEIDTKQLASGNYIVTVYTDGQVITKKLTVI